MYFLENTQLNWLVLEWDEGEKMEAIVELLLCFSFVLLFSSLTNLEMSSMDELLDLDSVFISTTWRGLGTGSFNGSDGGLDVLGISNKI